MAKVISYKSGQDEIIVTTKSIQSGMNESEKTLVLKIGDESITFERADIADFLEDIKSICDIKPKKGYR